MRRLTDTALRRPRKRQWIARAAIAPVRRPLLPFACLYCPQRFDTLAALTDHRARCGPEMRP